MTSAAVALARVRASHGAIIVVPSQEAALTAVKCQRDDALLRAARLRQHLHELMGPLALPDAGTLG